MLTCYLFILGTPNFLNKIFNFKYTSFNSKKISNSLLSSPSLSMVALSNGTTSARASGQQPHQQFAVLFHGMAAELKTSNSAWEGVCSRATKLASQLNATAGALGHFVDALQTVSDSANNVNGERMIIRFQSINEHARDSGISRDIGAALTRFCIRQRSIEAALRSLGQSLQSQFAVDLERKCADWRLSVNASLAVAPFFSIITPSFSSFLTPSAATSEPASG